MYVTLIAAYCVVSMSLLLITFIMMTVIRKKLNQRLKELKRHGGDSDRTRGHVTAIVIITVIW